jgi:hypothetical protein
MLRHPTNGLQWRKIERDYPDFAGGTRNLRFGLSTDGMNPFGEQSCSHSTWPVTLCIYNLRPWLCMKQKFIMMPVLIQGPKQPGNDIDVYLRPLIDELLSHPKIWNVKIKIIGTMFACLVLKFHKDLKLFALFKNHIGKTISILLLFLERIYCKRYERNGKTEKENRKENEKKEKGHRGPNWPRLRSGPRPAQGNSRRGTLAPSPPR